MPRGPRIDFPGLLHHVIFRGLNKMSIFRSDLDRQDLLSRFKKVLSESNAILYAWVFMDNHVHLLIKTTDVKLGKIMHRVLTGYAVRFNLKYHRCGYLYQGRFKSTVCDEEDYFLRLVRYIHLNPLIAGLVKDLEELENYEWSGHRVLVSRTKLAIQDKNEILRRFGGRKGYMEFLRSGMKKDEDLEGGGLRRSLGGISRAIKDDSLESYDQRILGSGEFVEAIWDQLEKEGKQVPRLCFDELALSVCRFCHIEPKKVVKWKGFKGSAEAKAILVSLATGFIGLTGATTGRKMNLTSQRISQLKYLGERLLKEQKLRPETILGIS